MKREYTDSELQAQILYYLWNQGSWGEIYTNYTRMKKRLHHIVKNNGKNVERQVKALVKQDWVEIHKNGDTLSLNPVYQVEIRGFKEQHGF